MNSTFYAKNADGTKSGRRYKVDIDNLKISDMLWYAANYHLAPNQSVWGAACRTARFSCVTLTEFVNAHACDKRCSDEQHAALLHKKQVALLLLRELGCDTNGTKVYSDIYTFTDESWEEVQQYRYSWLMLAYHIALEEEAQQALEEQQHAAQRPLPINYSMPTAE